MASFTSRLAGWAAGRLGGEKSRKKTMEFVDKTGVGKLLGLVGDAALLGGVGKLAGAGATAMGFGKAATGIPALPANAPMIETAVPKSVMGMGAGTPNALKALPAMGKGTTAIGQRVAGAILPPAGVGELSTAAPSLLSRAGAGAMNMAKGAGAYLAKKPEVAGQALMAYTTARQGGANRQLERERLAQQAELERESLAERGRLEREAMAQRESQFGRTFGQSEAERQREIERQRRIAEMLAPLFNRIAGGQG